jgi:NADPH-dependent 2,4-dienoyl-CoA reductase/sulfur reductase-like enzyme
VSPAPRTIDVAVVGAGPFGLSVAAHLAPRLRVTAFGEPMETWKRMPADMLLRSAWEETSLSAPGGAGSLDEWVGATGEPRAEPIPLAAFLRYAAWFEERYAPVVDPSPVSRVERANGGFRATTEAGDDYEASALVLAVGVVPFLHVPAAFRDCPNGTVVSTLDMPRTSLDGSRVLVIGGGQGAAEAAAAAARQGAGVELVTRGRLHWFADREPHYPRGPVRRWAYRVAYPVVGYGPPPINRIVTRPDAFAALPPGLRARLTRRLLRPGASAELRPHLEGKVRLTEGRRVERAAADGENVVVHLDDGTTRSVDRIVLGTGVRFDLDRLVFLSDDLRREIRTEGAWPVLDREFRSTAPGVFLVGYAAEGRFGPISRFVLGADFAARRVASALTGGR